MLLPKSHEFRKLFPHMDILQQKLINISSRDILVCECVSGNLTLTPPGIEVWRTKITFDPAGHKTNKNRLMFDLPGHHFMVWRLNF